MASDIFDFQIAIEARDNATAVLENVTSNFIKLDKLMDDADKKKKNKKEEKEGKEKNPAKGMIEELRGVVDAIAGFSKTIEDMFDKTYLGLEKGFRQVTSQYTSSLGEADAATDQFVLSTLKLANETGANVEKVGALFAGLGQYSIFLDDADIESNAATITELGTTYGMTADKIATLVGGTRFLGTDIGEAMDTAAAASQKFKVPGLIQAMPEIIQSTNEIFAEYGDRVTGDSQKIQDAFIEQAATVSKAYNIDIQSAIQKVSGTMKKFVGELDSIDDVRLGLADDFGEGTNALFELGYGLEETKRLLEDGKTNALGYAEAILASANNKPLAERERILKLIARSSSEQVKNMLLRPKILKAEQDARAAATTSTGKALASFAEATKSFKSTGSQAIAIFNNLVALGKVIVGSVFGPMAKDMFGNASKGLKGINESLIALQERVSDPNGFFKRFGGPVLAGIGTVALGISGAVASIAGAFGLLGAKSIAGKGIDQVKSFLDPKKGGKIVKFINNMLGKFGSLGKVFKFLGGIVKGFAKVLGWPLTAIMGIGTALSTLGKVFRDPDATGIEKFGGLIAGIFDGLDSVLLGIPGMIMGALLPGFENGIGAGINDLFSGMSEYFTGDGFSKMLGNMWAKVSEFFSTLPEKISKFFTGIGPMIIDVGKNIGAGIGGLIQMVFKAVWFQMVTLPKMVADAFVGVWKWFTGEGTSEMTDGVMGMVVNAMASAQTLFLEGMSAIGLFLKGIFAGILESFGQNWNTLWLNMVAGYYKYFENPFLDAMGAAVLGIMFIWGKFKKMKIKMWSAFEVVVEEFVYAAKTLFFGLIKAVGDKWANLLSLIGKGMSLFSPGIGTMIQSAAEKLRAFTASKANKLTEAHNLELARIKGSLDKKLSAVNQEDGARLFKYGKEVLRRRSEERERGKALEKETNKFKQEQRKRVSIEAAARKANKENKEKEKGAFTEDKIRETLGKSAVWAKAVEDAYAAVDKARSAAVAKGLSTYEVNAEANRVGFQEAIKLKKIEEAILTGKLKERKAFDTSMLKKTKTSAGMEDGEKGGFQVHSKVREKGGFQVHSKVREKPNIDTTSQMNQTQTPTWIFPPELMDELKVAAANLSSEVKVTIGIDKAGLLKVLKQEQKNSNKSTRAKVGQ
jgi:hypothetical protein